MRTTTLTTFLLLLTNLVMGQTSLQGLNLSPGNFQVGFKHYVSHDSSRTYQKIFDWNNQFMPRPIPISIWYPARRHTAEGKKMHILDYMEILKQEEEWEHLPNEQILNWFKYPNTPANQTHLKEVTTAIRDLRPANGAFPAIVYAPSLEASSIENFALCEYLASHGFVVIASPSRGHSNRYFDRDPSINMEAQARDIEFLMQEVSGLSLVDPDQIATMGFSFGGLSGVLAQMRNANLKAVASLDGSIKYQYGVLQRSPFAQIHLANVPFIHMSQKDIPEEVLRQDKIDPTLNTDFEFYDSLQNCTAYRLKFHDLTHGHFSTLGVLFQPRDKRQDKGDDAIMKSYEWVAHYTLQFLEAHLKQNGSALQFLNNAPEKNGVPKGLISAHSKSPAAKSWGLRDFNELAMQNNYKNLEELYRSLLEEQPSLDLPEWQLNNLGLQLVFNPETASNGIAILLLATTIYPRSANLFDSLAEGYLHNGDRENAVKHFKQSLKLDASNQNAIQKLKMLER